MEAQLQRPTHDLNQYEEDPHAGSHSVAEGEGGGEKKSVLKMVKDKAKKIKDTIKKHGHGHDQQGEDDEDAEMVDDPPEVHDAPMYDSPVIRSTNLPKQVDVNLEKPTDPREDRYDPKVRAETVPEVRDEGVSGPTGLVKTATEPREDRYDPKVRAETVPEVRDEGVSGPTGLVKTATELGTQPHMPEMKDTMPHNTGLGKPDVEDPKIPIRPIGGLEEDPHSLKTRPEEVPVSNYESKVNDDPTGHGEGEAKVDPLACQLQNLDVRGDESESNPKPQHGSYTGSHDQFAPQPTPTKDQFSPQTNSRKIIDPANPGQSMPQDTVAGKLSSATSALTEKALSAKNVVASKLGYAGTQDQQEKVPGSRKPVTETATEYAHGIAEKLTPVYERVAGAGTAVVSKVMGSGGSEGRVAEKGSDKGVSMKEYWAQKLRPGDEDKALSEVITEALHKKKEAGQVSPVIGKVVESEQEQTRLGMGEENRREGEDALAAGSEGVGSGQGMADRLKGAVSSWLGKSTGVQTAQDSVGQSYVSGSGSGPTAGVGQGGQDAAHGSNR